MHIDLIGYVNIIIGFINFILAILVYRANSRKRSNGAYSLCTLTMAFWSWGLFFYDNPLILSSSFWLKIVYVLAYLMALTQLNFIAEFNEKIDRRKIKLFLLLVLPLFFYGLYLLIVKDNIILNTFKAPISGVTIATMSKEYVIYAIPIFLTLSFLFFLHIKEWRQYSGLKKKQSFYYLIGGIFMVLPLLVLDFILPFSFGVTKYYRLSTLGNIFWAGIMAYSIYNTRFLDVRLVVGRLLNFLFRLFFVTVFLFFFVQLLELEELLSPSSDLSLLIIISFVFLLVYDLAVSRVETFIRNRYVYSKYDPAEELQKFTSANAKELDLKKVLENTSNVIGRSVKPQFISIIVFDKKNMNIITQEERGVKLSNFIEAKEFLQTWDNLNSNPVLVLSEMQEDISTGKEIIDNRKSSIMNFMNNHNIEIVFPLELQSNEEAILILGQKADNTLYSTGDMDFLNGIAKNTNISVERAILYSELSNFNVTLAQKVNNQTRELKLKITELEEARRKERDMLDIMGHELRTPATIAKLNIDFMNKYVDTNPKEYKKYLDRVKNSVENEIRLINSLLTSAKLEGEKVNINRERLSLKEVIEHAVNTYAYDAQNKGLKIIQDIDENTPDAYADSVRVTEVMDNLLSNAIKYTEEGSIIIQTTHTSDHVQINIIDSGMGIPVEEMPKLGTKFHRVENYIEGGQRYRVVRPGGTGLGLYVVFALVEQMGGKVWVKSELGKGTTFSFTLPVYTGQRADIVDAKTKDMYKRYGLKKEE